MLLNRPTPFPAEAWILKPISSWSCAPCSIFFFFLKGDGPHTFSSRPQKGWQGAGGRWLLMGLQVSNTTSGHSPKIVWGAHPACILSPAEFSRKDSNTKK